MTEYECRNPKCHMHRFTSEKALYQCPVCYDTGSDSDLMNVSEEKDFQDAWKQEIAREAAAMHGQQAYDDHMGVSFGPLECYGCGIKIEQGTRCEWC